MLSIRCAALSLVLPADSGQNSAGAIHEESGIPEGKVKFYDIRRNAKSVPLTCFLLFVVFTYKLTNASSYTSWPHFLPLGLFPPASPLFLA